MRRTKLALPLLLAALGCTRSDPTAPTGAIVVTAVTTGPDADADGYDILVDGSQESPLPSNGSSSAFSDLEVGSHSVVIRGVNPNCAVSPSDSQIVEVDAARTVTVTFSVTCAAFGAVEITATTVGVDLDPDGLTASVDFAPARALPINGSVIFPQIAPGTHNVLLSGVSGNCTVSPSQTISVTVASAATTPVAVAVNCVQEMPTGSVIAFVRAVQIGYDFERGPILDREIEVVSGGFVPRDLTNSRGSDGPPVWSPDATRIAFVSTRDGNSEIYVMSADGLAQTDATHNAAVDNAPVWSPDGSRIAFVSDRDGNNEIYVMAADGSGLTNLTNNAASDVSPAWSPDGTKIAFTTDRDGNKEIYEMRADGSQPVDRSNNAGADWAPTWSPDGGRLSFHTDRDGHTELYVMRADGSAQIDVSNSPDSAVGSEAWSPDGTRIAFVRRGIAVVNVDGTGLTTLVANIPTCATGSSCISIGYFGPTWSPDGTKLAFNWVRTRSLRECDAGCYYKVTSRSSGISVMDPDGSARYELVSDPFIGDYGAVWRPR